MSARAGEGFSYRKKAGFSLLGSVGIDSVPRFHRKISRDWPRPANRLGRMLRRFFVDPRVSKDLSVMIEGVNISEIRR